MFLTVTLNAALDKTIFLPYNAPYDTIRCGRPTNLAGGKGLNVARALLALGERPRALFPVAGHTGAHLLALARAEGIEPVVVPVPGENRLSLTLHDERTGEYWHYVEAGPDLSREEIDRIWDAFELQTAVCHTIVVAGSLPCPEAADLPRRMLNAGRQRGIRTVLDCFGPSQREALFTGAWMVKPTREELASTLGVSLDTDAGVWEALMQTAAAGVVLAIASDGDAGALAVADGERLRVRPPRLPAVCDLGGGDSMVAGICWAAHQGMPLAECLRWGAACGAANAMTADAGRFDIEFARSLLGQIEILKEN